ncbi:Rad2 nuclease [Ophidiomyces ophidiicola]|nr:Rad2 nuclease [Ophidiomyces ophidiicola]
MGIAGLHGLLKSIQKPSHIKKFKGKPLGIDAYGWLHRGTIACAIDLALGYNTTKYVEFAMQRVRMLLYYGVVPYLVFDGGKLPSKYSTETARAERREESKILGLELYRTGHISQAQQQLQKAIDVTPQMARLLIEELKRFNIQYLVAPYEADAELVYLEKEGIIHGILSEDSDMLVFGAKLLLSKLDKHGNCVEINRKDFPACRDINLVGWTDQKFRQMCILSGCDYLPNIPRIGLKTAYRNLKKYNTIERVVKILQFDGRSLVPPNYMDHFDRAELTFLHQRVFCPTERKLVPLNPLPDNLEGNIAFIGDDIEADIAIRIAYGDLDPITKEPICIQSLLSERARMASTGRQVFNVQKRPIKPIDSFFTPTRVPLGELDPNILTPSPSQQALLDQSRGISWTATPISVSQSSPAAPGFQLPARAIQIVPFSSQTGNSTRSPPVKRQRLCSDADQRASVEEHSHFFTDSASFQNAGRGAISSKRRRRTEFEIFSDDSIDRAMLQLDNKTKNATYLSTLHRVNLRRVESSNATGESRRPIAPGKCTASSPCHAMSISQTRTLRTLPSMEKSPSPKKFNPASATHIPRASHRDARQSSATSPIKAYNIPTNQIITNDEARSQTEKLPLHHGTTWQVPRRDKQVRRLNLTPLQRLQRTALSRSKSMNFTKREALNLGKDEPGYTSECSVTKPTEAIDMPYHPVATRGSEDSIIPSTDNENDSLSDEGECHRFGSSDLRRFEFKPK